MYRRCAHVQLQHLGKDIYKTQRLVRQAELEQLCLQEPNDRDICRFWDDIGIMVP